MGKPFKHEELSRKFIGASMAVLNELKPSLDEKLYERSLVLELRSMSLPFEQQKQHSVFYKGKEVGILIPHLIISQAIIVDTNVVTAFNESPIAQMIGYLNITGLDVGLLINFKYRKLEWKRVLRPDNNPPSV